MENGGSRSQGLFGFLWRRAAGWLSYRGILGLMSDSRNKATFVGFMKATDADAEVAMKIGGLRLAKAAAVLAFLVAGFGGAAPAHAQVGTFPCGSKCSISVSPASVVAGNPVTVNWVQNGVINISPCQAIAPDGTVVAQSTPNKRFESGNVAVTATGSGNQTYTMKCLAWEGGGTTYWMVAYATLAVTPAAPPLPPEPPALPPPPPLVGGATVNPLAFGSTGSGAAAGSGTTSPGTARGGVPFDYTAFCNSPDSAGNPRNPAWIASCLANQGVLN